VSLLNKRLQFKKNKKTQKMNQLQNYYPDNYKFLLKKYKNEQIKKFKNKNNEKKRKITQKMYR
jgi:hypothetical protein